MATSYNIRPTQIAAGSDIFLVRHESASRTVVEELRFEARTTDESIAKMTADDSYTFMDAETGDEVKVVRAEGDKAHLVIAGTKTRVSFWQINDESIEMKKASDLQNTIRQRAIDAREAERKINEEARVAREAARAERTTKKAVSSEDRTARKLEIINKRIATLKEDLAAAEETREAILNPPVAAPAAEAEPVAAEAE